MERFDDQPAMTPEERRGLPARLLRLIRVNRVLVAAMCAAALFLLLMDEVMEPDAMRIDRWAYWLFVQNLRVDWLTPIMEGFSALASPVVLVVLLLVIAAFVPGKRPGWCCALNLVLVALLNVGLKALIQRPRPEGFRLIEETGFSFPSGHSMVAMAFFGLIIWLVWRYESDRRQRLLLSSAFAIVIVMIGISRIYLGVHYASDVIGGFAASLVWLCLYTRLAVPLFLGPVGDDAGAGAPSGGAGGAEYADSGDSPTR